MYDTHLGLSSLHVYFMWEYFHIITSIFRCYFVRIYTWFVANPVQFNLIKFNCI